MGGAAQTSVIASPEKAVARKRPLKPLKDNTHCENNIIAIRHLHRTETQGAAAATLTEGTGNLAVAPAPSYAPGTNGTAADGKNLQTSICDDFAIVRVATNNRRVRRNRVASGVLAALTAGAVLGGTLMSDVQNDETDATGTHVISDSQYSPALLPEQSLVAAKQDSDITLPPAAPYEESDVNFASQKPDPMHTRTDQYLVEIERLRSQNNSLNSEVDVLDAETFNLNNELLQLELSMTALELEAQPPVVTRTVYNFVNTSNGSNIQSDEREPYDYSASSWETETYGAVDQFSEEPIEWDSQGQPIEYVESFVGPTGSEQDMDFDSNMQYIVEEEGDFSGDSMNSEPDSQYMMHPDEDAQAYPESGAQ